MKSILLKVTLSAAFMCGCVISTNAQGVNIAVDANDVNIMSSKPFGVEGSPYLYNTWSKGSVTLANGIVYDGMSLLFDQMKDELVFNADGNKRQLFMEPVHEFTIQEPGNKASIRRFRNGFPAVDGESVKAFYEVLADGDTKLLKRSSKAIVEERSTSSHAKTKQIKESVKYYIATPDKMVKIKKDKKSVITALGTKQPELEAYITTNKLNVKNDADLTELVIYFNSLN
ncbi:hypothetical protein [Pontibacter vulgaris]|uniref:hypothetical protein n=1 Tax=Pontibacter vulgaris TaxID=2905679 RepID=UPI001FA7EC9B|nr:hypothetical protein [Pontibacter vulgaris]